MKLLYIIMTVTIFTILIASLASADSHSGVSKSTNYSGTLNTAGADLDDVNYAEQSTDRFIKYANERSHVNDIPWTMPDIESKKVMVGTFTVFYKVRKGDNVCDVVIDKFTRYFADSKFYKRFPGPTNYRADGTYKLNMAFLDSATTHCDNTGLCGVILSGMDTHREYFIDDPDLDFIQWKETKKLKDYKAMSVTTEKSDWAGTSMAAIHSETEGAAGLLKNYATEAIGACSLLR